MPYPQDIIRLQVSGLGPESESWSWSLHLADLSDGAGGGGTFGSVPAAIASAIETFHASTFISNQARLNSIKYNPIGPDGKYLDKFGTVEKTYATPIAGGLSGSPLPLQVACAVSLHTDRERGLASRGRFFIPYPAVTPTAGRWTSTVCTTIATAARTMINAINAGAGGPVVVVASNTRTGAIAPVRSIAVGDRPDVIRSRGRSLKETYQLANIT